MMKHSKTSETQTITKDDSDPVKERYVSSLGMSLTRAQNRVVICDEHTNQRVELTFEVSWIKGDNGAESRPFVGIDWDPRDRRWADGSPVTEEQEARINAFVRAIRFPERPIYAI